MIKKLLVTLFVVTSALTASQKSPILLDDLDVSKCTFLFSSSKVVTNNIDGEVKLYCDKNGFVVKHNDCCNRVKPEDTHKLFRQVDLKSVVKYSAFNKFKLSQMDNGNYAVTPLVELVGGGVGGANVGFFGGKFAVHFLAHGTFLVIAGLTGPAAPATLASLELTFLPLIESTSNVVGIGTGILLAVVTGPV